MNNNNPKITKMNTSISELKENTYVFEIGEDTMENTVTRVKRKIWQILPAVSASLIGLPFGLMLGWPSPTYPKLLEPTSFIHISLDQSAMIAGFLMIGLTISTPISSGYHLGPKFGIIIGATLMTLGWILMWQATNIYWLLGSRLILGCGNGYGLGQAKNYVHEMCGPNLGEFLEKQMNFYALAGLIVAFSMGNYVTFQQFSIISIGVSLGVLFLVLFLPPTPKEFARSGNMSKAIKVLDYLRGTVDHKEEIDRIRRDLDDKPNNTPLFANLRRNRTLLERFAIFLILLFCQQFVGAPSTVVFSQIIFERSNCWYPEYCAIVYSIVFFVTAIYGTFYAPSLGKKKMLLFSSTTLTVILLIKILVIYFKINERFWPFTSLVVMLFYISFYNVGMGTIPVTLINDFFPKSYRQTMKHIFIMCFSMLALIITKIFQVLMQHFALYIPFCLYIAVSTFSVIFIIIFVPTKVSNLNSSKQTCNKGSRLNIDLCT